MNNLAEIFPVFERYGFVWMKVLRIGLIMTFHHSSNIFSSSPELERIAFSVVNEKDKTKSKSMFAKNGHLV